jgi:co-chaperonin GroES (HSP10)
MTKNIKMVGDNILVYVKIPKQETESGIIINEDTAREVQKNLTGEIIATGPDVEKFAEGDEILLPPGGSIPVSYEDEVYHVFKEFALFAKLVK